jgi:acetyl-CoA C-acetyltransferase/acetyl-CoA acyltransferase
MSTSERIAIVDGLRTPLAKAGTALADVPAVELARHVMRELIDRLNFDANEIDEVIFGCVGQPSDAQNIARSAALLAGVPRKAPAVTVHRNCASGFESITTAAERIFSGRGSVYLVGGAESMSNYPLLFPKSFANWMGDLAKAKSFGARLSTWSRFRPSMLKPRIGVIEGLTDYACGLNMGVTAENLAVEFGISRKEQDEFSLESHRRASASALKLAEEITPFPVPPYKEFFAVDNGPRANQSMEALGKLRPVFDRAAGTVTAGNACPITDGAAALLIMSEERAKALGYEPKAYLRAYAYAGLDPERMGLGPVFATAKVLETEGHALSDMELVEVNEAFAAQVIACERAFGSKTFANRELGRSIFLGEIDRARLNVNGGAIALGHPVGATGARLVITLIEELRRRGLGLGLATLCIGGGQGGALVVER